MNCTGLIRRVLVLTITYLLVIPIHAKTTHINTVNSSASFLDTIKQIHQISDTDANQALEQINQLKLQLNKQSIEDQLEYYHLLAEIYITKGNYKEGKASTEQGLVLASGLISPRIIITKLLYSLGYMLESLGELDPALGHYLHGLDIAESLEDQKNIAIGLINIGAIYYQTQQYAQALVTINDAAIIAKNLPDIELKGFVNSELGILYSELGKHEKAIEYYESSYHYYHEVGKPFLAINNLRNMAMIYWEINQADKAIATYHELLNVLETQPHIEMQFSAHIGLAQIYADQAYQNYDLAMEHLKKIENLVSQVEHHSLPLQFLIEQSSVLKDLAQYDQALNIISQAFELMSSKKVNFTPANETRLLVLRSEIYRLTGRFKEAYDTYLRVYKINMNNFQNSRTQAVTELRLDLESQGADLEKNLLENKNKIESILLTEAKAKAESKRHYTYLSAIITLVFVFLFVQLLKSQKLLLTLTRIDSLTQVFNRQRFMQLAKTALINAKQQELPVSLIAIDCDYFKRINDNFGYEKGDQALVILSNTGKEHFIAPSLFARYAGKKFIALLPDTTIEHAKEQAQLLCSAVKNHPWNDDNEYLLSVSCGVVSTASLGDYTLENLLQKADVLLYRAEENGRSQVCT